MDFELDREREFAPPPDLSADDDPTVTASGVHRREGDHVHGAGLLIGKGVRLCCYCDVPVHLTELGWQPLSSGRSAALLAQYRGGRMPWAEGQSADRMHWWHWLRYPRQAWRILRQVRPRS